MSEDEWRSFGIRQSPGWFGLSLFLGILDFKQRFLLPYSRVHYMIHNPEPHILMFRREVNYQDKYPNGRLLLT